ncbi:MAG: short-chain fatty acid transporter [Acholeplasmataceae bacterium]|nr:short-chain fatty acid transporter [Acholeplasmataceae bacterium]
METITRFCLKVVQKYLPGAFLLAIFLTFVTFFAGIVITGKSFTQMINYWGNGYSSLFTFGMQMVLVLLTGYVLALTSVAKNILDKITDIPKSPKQALGLTALVSLISCYLNWGFGLVIGAILAKEMGRKVKGLHFPLLVAAAYGGEIVRGPSSSIPLVAATPGNFMVKLGVPLIPVTETLYSSWNVLLTLAIAAALFFVYFHMKAPDGVMVEYVDKDAPKAAPKEKKDMTPAEKLEHSYIINLLFGLLPLSYLVLNFAKIGFNLNLNLVVLIFLTAGLLLHKNPNAYLDAVAQAIGACRGIILQFPLYAGISGMIIGSGMVQVLSNAFVAISTPQTFPLFTFLSAGLVNIFIPSGGGQWAIQGPIMMEAAQKLGADIPQTIMAFAWGDGWTNQIQPFWALPLLGVAGLGARDIMGYCVIWTAVSGLIICGTFFALTLF